MIPESALHRLPNVAPVTDAAAHCSLRKRQTTPEHCRPLTALVDELSELSREPGESASKGRPRWKPGFGLTSSVTFDKIFTVSSLFSVTLRGQERAITSSLNSLNHKLCKPKESILLSVHQQVFLKFTSLKVALKSPLLPAAARIFSQRTILPSI